MFMKKLITSALPYVNNVPHLGNIIGCVLSADAYARFCRARGYETLYVCGTDEYGTATETKAREEGLTPRQVCDKYHEIHRGIYEAFAISFDVFGRTSTEEQTVIAQEIFTDLDAGGLIAEQKSERTFCEKCAMFLADRFVEGTCPHCGYDDARGDQCDSCGKLLEPENLVRPRCKQCGAAPVLKETAHLYLALDQLQEPLTQWAEKAWQAGGWTNNAVQTTQGWFERGLQPRPITRDLTWGIPVPRPGYEKKVFYVWFDAPIGYISITAKQDENWRRWWQDPEGVRLYQFMAKDNIPFHTVIFPASLLGTGKPWTMLHHINSTEYLNYEDTKFSKSRDIGVFGDDVRQTGIPVDLWRFYLLRIRPEKNDSAFTWHDFFEKVNGEFTDNIGNLVNRALVYLQKNFDGEIRDLPLPETHSVFAGDCRSDCEALTVALEAVQLREGLRIILGLGDRGNKFFQDMAPWDKIKTEPEHAHATVSLLTYLVRSLAVALEPYMPETARRIRVMLNLCPQEQAVNRPLGSWDELGSFSGLDGHRIGMPEILYRRLDLKLAEKLRKKFSGEQPDFGQFKLQVGQVLEVRPHPEADHLYHLSVDLGEGAPRSIVAGLVKHYAADELQGRRVIVLANLKVAELKGVPSQGMVLVCEKRNKMELLDGSPFAVGQVVTVAEQKVDHCELTIEQFKAAPLRVVDGALMFDDQACTIEGRPVVTSAVKNGKVR
ncbi:MAG: methionine--tRNA ligase [Deltaproteobacteria bacterium]|nr:methionine--tRNA ligase [Deltaproteobacteria bacterium]